MCSPCLTPLFILEGVPPPLLTTPQEIAAMKGRERRLVKESQDEKHIAHAHVLVITHKSDTLLGRGIEQRRRGLRR